jgi:hypothetical protein
LSTTSVSAVTIPFHGCNIRLRIADLEKRSRLKASQTGKVHTFCIIACSNQPNVMSQPHRAAEAIE